MKLMKLKMQRIAMAACGLALGSGLAQAKDFSPLGQVEKDGALGTVETVPEHGGVGVFTAIGVLGITAWMLFRQLRRQRQQQ